MQMTRLAPQPARARVRQLVAVWLGCVFWLSMSASARAQVRAELERALTVTRELPGCVSAAALRARTAQYLDRGEQLSELTIEVDLQVPQFRVLREGTLLAERRFGRAPRGCTERRDALALAVAIAIEQVAEAHAADSGSQAQPTAAAPDPERAELADENRSDDQRAGHTRGVDARAAARAGDPSTRVEAGRPRDGDGRAASRVGDPSTRVEALRATGGDARSASRAGDPSTRDEALRARDGDARAASRASVGDAGSGGPSARVAGADEVGSGRIELRPRADASAEARAGRESDSPPSAADQSLDARTLTPSGRPRAVVSLVGGGAVLFEALPTAAAGFAAGAELAPLPALRIGLSGLFSLPVSSSFQGGTVSAQLFGAQLTGCVNAPIFTGFLLHGCAGAVGGVIDARGDDFALNLSDQMGWIAGLVRARLEYPAAGRVAAGVYADARLNVLRPELQAGLASEPARTRAVALFGATLGVELIVRLH